MRFHEPFNLLPLYILVLTFCSNYRGDLPADEKYQPNCKSAVSLSFYLNLSGSLWLPHLYLLVIPWNAT